MKRIFLTLGVILGLGQLSHASTIERFIPSTSQFWRNVLTNEDQIGSAAALGIVGGTNGGGTVITSTVPLVSATAAGIQDTNSWAWDLVPPEARTGPAKTPPIIIEPYLVRGAANYGTDYWNLSFKWYTNGLYKIWPDASINIEVGWAGYRDTNGNLVPDQTKFPPLPGGTVWSGMSNVVYSIKTNGIPWINIYTENRVGVSDAGSPTNAGIWGHWQQDCSNFVYNLGINAVRSDVPKSTPGTSNQSAINAYSLHQIGYWMRNYLGYEPLIGSTGWNDTNNPPVLAQGSANYWYIVGDLGDVTGQGDPPHPYQSIWTNFMPHIPFSMKFQKNGGRGCWQAIETSFMFFNQFYYEINLMNAGAIFIGQPYAPGEGLAYQQLTNVYMKAILDDPLGIPGWQVISNSTGNGEVWVRPLANGDRAVLMFNKSTNVTESVGFDVRDVGFALGASVTLFETYYCTNGYSSGGVFTNSVEPMGSYLYRVSPGSQKSSLAPSQSVRTGFQGYDPYLANGSATTEAQYILYSQIVGTNSQYYQRYGPAWISINLGWSATNRDANGNIVADPTKFPDGMSNTVYYMHTNGVKVRGYDTALQSWFGLPGSGGPNGDNQYLSQDLSNFVFGFKWDGLRYDYPINVGAKGRNSTISAYTAQAQSILQSLTGTSFPLWTYGYDLNSDPIVPNGVNGFTFGGGWLDQNSQLNGWVGFVSFVETNIALLGLDGNGTFANYYATPVTYGNGYAEIQAALASPLWYGIPYALNGYQPGLTMETNSYLQQIEFDPLGLPGSMIISNSNYQILSRSLSGGNKYVVMINPSTNANVTASFQSSDLGFQPGAQFKATEIMFQTNVTAVSSISDTVPALGCLAYLVSPLGPLPDNLAVKTISVSSGTVTNNGLVWLVTNNVPNASYPDGSLASRTDTGAVYSHSNGVWSLIGPSPFDPTQPHTLSSGLTNTGFTDLQGGLHVGTVLNVDSTNSMTTVSNLLDLGWLSANGITNTQVKSATVLGTDANGHVIASAVSGNGAPWATVVTPANGTVSVSTNAPNAGTNNYGVSVNYLPQGANTTNGTFYANGTWAITAQGGIQDTNPTTLNSLTYTNGLLTLWGNGAVMARLGTNGFYTVGPATNGGLLGAAVIGTDANGRYIANNSVAATTATTATYVTGNNLALTNGINTTGGVSANTETNTGLTGVDALATDSNGKVIGATAISMTHIAQPGIIVTNGESQQVTMSNIFNVDAAHYFNGPISSSTMTNTGLLSASVLGTDSNGKLISNTSVAAATATTSTYVTGNSSALTNGVVNTISNYMGTLSAGTYLIPTNAINTGVWSVGSGGYTTNLSGNVTLGLFGGIPNNQFWSIYANVTNTGASVFSITFPTGTREAGTAPAVFYFTNGANQYAEVQITGFGLNKTNVNVKYHY